MRDAVIVDAVRTPVGKRHGALAQVHPVELSAHVLKALSERTGLDPDLVDDVVWGCMSQIGEQAACIGRYSVLAAGWPEGVPAVTIDRQCGSSQQAVHFAAAGVISGQYNIAVAGGVESVSHIPPGAACADEIYGRPYGPGVSERYGGFEFSPGAGAQMIADEYALSREAMDEYSLRSHERAAMAIEEDRFKDQIAPIAVTDAEGRQCMFDTDEGVRRGGTMQSMASLKPAFTSDGTITVGNASQVSDGAAALLITTSEVARLQGWRPIARVHTAVTAATSPVSMLKGPIPATAKVLDRAGLALDDIGAFEVNEAFASVPLAWLRETNARPGLLNSSGGAIALGHPLGASGARLMTTLVHHMREREICYGLQTICEGGGMANATILELVP